MWRHRRWHRSSGSGIQQGKFERASGRTDERTNERRDVPREPNSPLPGVRALFKRPSAAAILQRGAALTRWRMGVRSTNQLAERASERPNKRRSISYYHYYQTLDQPTNQHANTPASQPTVASLDLHASTIYESCVSTRACVQACMHAHCRSREGSQLQLLDLGGTRAAFEKFSITNSRLFGEFS